MVVNNLILNDNSTDELDVIHVAIDAVVSCSNVKKSTKVESEPKKMNESKKKSKVVMKSERRDLESVNDEQV